MRVSVSPARVEVTAGIPQTIAITITNPGTVIGGYALRLLGADPSWVELEEERISLFPDESRTLVATVNVPAGLAAGERRMAVQVRELTPPERSAVEEFVLVVPEAPSTQVRIDPVTLTAGRTGRFSLLIDNNGNTPARGWLAGLDAESAMRYRFDPPTIDLAPGEHAVVDLRARGRRPLIGQPVVRVLDIHLVEGGPPPSPDRHQDAPRPPDPEQRPATTASLVQTAVLSRGPIGLFGLLAALTVFALVLTIALSRLVGQSAADRNLALEIAAADGSGTTSGNSGVAGTVRLLTTGLPVSGVAVNVYSAEDLVTPLASDATDAEGGYRIDGLAAGDYKLVFRGAGFEPLWYPRSLGVENAETITVEADHRVAGLDVALGGAPATISGTVLGEDIADATVSLRTPETAPVAAPGAPVATGTVTGTGGATVDTAPVAADGTFSFANVPSPSVYDLVVTKKGYATSTQRVDVAAGEERQGVEINLVRGNGIISGSVTSNGKRIDGVTITATSGESSSSTVSLSSGDVGSFTLRRLPTPGVYTVVASKEGYASQTLSLTLADGQELTGVALSLGASSGSLSGRALLSGGGPAAGVTVTVTDGVRSVETATQSSGKVGNWKVSGLDLPGTYTVTFSRSDLAAQTVSVTLDQVGTITPSSIGATVTSHGIETVMKSSTTVLEGRVTQPAIDNVVRPVGEVTVELSSGSSTYRVTTASVPSDQRGRYRVEGLPPGTYTVSVSRAGVRPTSTILQLAAGDTRDYSPELAKAASLSGTVTVADSGAPVGGGYLVELYRAASYPGSVYRTTRTDAAGNYQFADVDAPEVYVVQVRRTQGAAPIGSGNATVAASQQATRNVSVTP
ncbi:carboxypeptidase regulatory-like domain-containing protein [Nocardioides sp. BYT-33-1]|uniref:carboxypeptidase regulatory-like domain-containing protein n=1 Tax=Nocardioides sp. BYT-33-1 TaxID=3416952 RepID=UPI003F53807D